MAPEEKPKQKKDDATLPEDWEKVAGGGTAPVEKKSKEERDDETSPEREKDDPPAFM